MPEGTTAAETMPPMRDTRLNSPVPSDGAPAGLPAVAKGEFLKCFPAVREKIERAVEEGTPLRVLISDIDGTLHIGAGHTAIERTEGREDLRRLITTLQRDGWLVFGVTGSHFDTGSGATQSIRSRIESGELPAIGDRDGSGFAFDGIVTDGGADLFAPGLGGTGTRVPTLRAGIPMPDDTEYERTVERATELCRAINARSDLHPLDFELIRRFDGHLPAGAAAFGSRIFPQLAAEDLAPHRASGKYALYFYAASTTERDLIAAAFSAAFPEQRIVCCEERDANTAARRLLPPGSAFPRKYCLDIVPFDKGTPVDFLARELAASVALVEPDPAHRPRLQVWYAGDAGNDLPAAAAPAVTDVIIVGGASEELVRAAEGLSRAGKRVFVDEVPGRIGPASIREILAVAG